MKMIVIFAKYGTTERIALFAQKHEMKQVQEMLCDQLGGEWVCLDALQPKEVLKFTDEKEYKGFTNKSDRYTTGIYELI